MEFPPIRTVKQKASESLAAGRDPKRVVLVFAGLCGLISGIVTLLSFYLSSQMSKTGGLDALESRSILTTAEAVLPIFQLVVTLCLNYGYLHAMMRISRGLYADHHDLKTGFHLFGPIFRFVLLQTLIYLAIGVLSYNASTVFMSLSPWGEKLMASITALMDEAAATGSVSRIDPIVYILLIVWLVVFSVISLFVSYRLRMTNYILLDNPRSGALYALLSSIRMMRGNSMKLFKLDLSFWWYYVLTFAVTLAGMGDVILMILGIPLPFSPNAVSLLFFGLYLLLQFAVCCFAMNKVELTYIHTYEALQEKPKTDGVVLGNIFEM